MPTRRDFQGILLPTTTPFDPQGSIAWPALRANLESWNKTGIRGYVLLGSTGERVHLDDREYVEAIETARAVVPRELVFVVGAGQQSTLGTVKEVKGAARAGADAVLVITPYFYRS